VQEVPAASEIIITAVEAAARVGIVVPVETVVQRPEITALVEVVAVGVPLILLQAAVEEALDYTAVVVTVRAATP
jgi:hypothetical protein